MFKILLISLITFMIVIIAFLILMSFLDVDIITHSKSIEKFYNAQELSFTGGAFKSLVNGSTNDFYIQFNSSGTLTIPSSITCDILVIGGGGGGGTRHAGGGGAGAVIYLQYQTLNSGTYTITIGSGGNGKGNGTGIGRGTNGNDSIISLNNNNIYLAKGGGGGAYGVDGGNGGSGGGISWSHRIGTVVNTNIPFGIYGNNGGNGTGGGAEYTWGGGGGGGATSPGLNAVLNGNISTAGNGGNGRLISITGTNIYYGGGGGGGVSWNGNSAGSGGLGGGGAGSKGPNTATSGTANTGGGGGGAGFQGGTNGQSGAGGSGVVIIRNISNKQYYTDLRNLFTNKIPWGEYYAENFDGVYLNDTSGNKRHATTSGNIELISNNGNGALANVSYISGGTSSIISWPAGSIPRNFTFLSLTRYNGGSRQRILSSDRSAGNFLHGHWGYDIHRNGNINTYRGRGCVHYDGWKSPWVRPTLGNLDDWLCCIGKNGGSAPNNILFDGVPSGIENGGVGGFTLGINNNYWGENSDWALSCVIIWDQQLEDNEMRLLNKMIHEYKETGRTIIDIINNNNNNGGVVRGATTTTTALSQNDQYDEDNKAFTYYPKWDSTFSRGYSTSIKKNDINYNYSDSEILTNFGTFIGNVSKKISITFINSFVLKKIIIIAGSEILNAPSEWKINLGENNVPLIGTATKEDYNAIQGKSANFCVKFYIDNFTPSNTYDIIFTKTLGGTQLNFSKIILFEGTKPPLPSTNGALK